MSSYKSQQYSPVNRQEGYEKDIIISQLKSEIWELKQNERELSDIISHNKQLESQFLQLKDEKFRVENELQNKGLEQTKNLTNYRQRIDSLEEQLTEKKVELKKLYAENIAQREHVDHKQLEISRLKTENLHLEESLGRVQQESLVLRNELDSHKEFKRNILKDMEILMGSNDQLQTKSLDQEKILRQADYEKAQQDRFIDTLKSQVLDLENEVHTKSIALKEVQVQVQSTRSENMSLVREYEELERSREKIKLELLNTQTQLKEEVSKNFDLNSSLMNLESTLRSKTIFVEELKRQLDDVKRDVHETLEQNDLYSNELERLRRNLEYATAHNGELLRQLEQFSDQDEEMRGILDRKSQLREIHSRVDNFSRQSHLDYAQSSNSKRVPYSQLSTSALRQHIRRGSNTSASKDQQ